MTQTLMYRNVLLGFLSWLIPFAVSFFFFKPDGSMVVAHDVFKSIITVVGIMSGCYLLFRYFKIVESDFITNGFIVGWSWFVINIVLDTIVLIPMMKTTFPDYFMSVGLNYFSIPIISITIGYLLSRKLKVIAVDVD
jgi:hypothetical protein